MLSGMLLTPPLPMSSIRLPLSKVLSSRPPIRMTRDQLSITTVDSLSKLSLKNIMMTNRIPTPAFQKTKRLQFLTPKASHHTGDQTASQLPTRTSNSSCGPMETELALKSKMFSGIWDTFPSPQSNSTNGLDTQTSIPRIREIRSQLHSTDSTLRGSKDQPITTSCRNTLTVTEQVAKRLTFSGISETLALILIIFILYLNNPG